MSSPPGRRDTSPAPRDQHESAFTAILHNLVRRVPGAVAAVLVDRDGETVNYWGLLEPFDVKLAAAHWRIVLNDLRAQGALSTATNVVIRASRRSFVVAALPEDYALVLVLRRGAGFSGWRRAIPISIRALADEAGWVANRQPRGRWFPVRVTVNGQRKPTAVLSGGRFRPVVILGSVVGVATGREKGWRVRLDSGLEATLVREAGGSWYADDVDERHPAGESGPSKERR